MGFWQALLFPPLTTTSLSHDMAKKLQIHVRKLAQSKPPTFLPGYCKKVAIKKKIQKREFILKFSTCPLSFSYRSLLESLHNTNPPFYLPQNGKKVTIKRKSQNRVYSYLFLQVYCLFLADRYQKTYSIPTLHFLPQYGKTVTMK